ncbi:MAG: ABC transporter substrate binding protein [Acidobacteriota bacterium]
MTRVVASAGLMLILSVGHLFSQTPSVSYRQQVYFFKQVFPAKTQLGILWNQDLNKASQIEVDQAAMSYQVWPRYANVKQVGDIGGALRDLLNKAKAEAILLTADPVVAKPENQKYIITECMLKKIPVIGDSRAAVEAGAVYALEVQVVEERKNVVVLLNLKAAASLGIEIPRTILDTATVVVQP